MERGEKGECLDGVAKSMGRMTAGKQPNRRDGPDGVNDLDD